MRVRLRVTPGTVPGAYRYRGLAYAVRLRLRNDKGRVRVRLRATGEGPSWTSDCLIRLARHGRRVRCDGFRGDAYQRPYGTVEVLVTARRGARVDVARVEASSDYNAWSSS